MENNDLRAVLIVATAAVLFLGGLQGCVVLTNRQCQETNREAIKSANPTLQVLALTKGCPQ